MDWKTALIIDALGFNSCGECDITEDLRVCAGSQGPPGIFADTRVFCRDHHVEAHQHWGTTPEEDILNDGVFDASLAQNGQVTLKKTVRDALGIETSDIIILRVLRVLSPNGFMKWDSEKEVKA